MKFHTVVRLTVFSAWVWIAAAAPDISGAPGVTVQEKSVEALIQDLAHDQYRVRERASGEIWKIGEPALEALQEAAAGNDPEQAYWANELIRKIQLHITPDTDPAVISLVERYAKASPNEKIALFSQMHKRRAWRQILKLYASETNPELQSRLVSSIEGVAVVAARERLLAGDVRGAREFLEMAPADAAGLMALADFHRSQGTLDAELKRAKTLKGVQSDAWQLALYRAAGNLEAARDAATAAGDPMLSAAMSALLGDSLPWLRINQTDGEGGALHKSYTEIAIKRWLGKEIRPADLEPLVRAVNSKNRDDRQSAMNSLFLLGEPGLAEKAYVAVSRVSAFGYFESLERIPEALGVLGLDPENPDYVGWVEKHFKSLAAEGADQEDEATLDSQELILLGNFLERRGLHELCGKAFLKPLAALAEKEPKQFTELLAQLFGGDSRMSTEALGAPGVAKQAASAWAGDSAERWEEIVNCALGEQDEVIELWDWLGVLKPGASRIERFDALLALCGFGRDPGRLRGKWLELAWKAVKNTPKENQGPLLEKMSFVLALNPDVTNNLKLWDMLPESDRMESSWRTHILDLSAAGRWEEAAEFFQKQIVRISSAKFDPEPSMHACLAACLRSAGQIEQANAQDRIVDILALGNDAIEIANGYAYGGDYKRAMEWWARAARQNAPESQLFTIALNLYSQMLATQGQWKEVAAISEISAQTVASADSSEVLPLGGLRLRLLADLGRALSTLKTDRAKSIAILGKCHAMFPSDGSLADDFFPALRKTGLIKEHDEWFGISWDRMSAVLEKFPDADNTCNTTAWLASRARRKLDQAEKLLQHALALHPEQSAYLDTMAEIQFARGNREKAVEWSSEAINFMPLDSMLRRQHERFQNGPLPR